MSRDALRGFLNTMQISQIPKKTAEFLKEVRLELKKVTSLPATQDSKVARVQVIVDEPSLSRKWRISGILRSSRMSQVVLSSNTGNRTLPLNKFCKQIKGSPDWECIIDDETITTYSGTGSGFRLNNNLSTNTQGQLRRATF